MRVSNGGLPRNMRAQLCDFTSIELKKTARNRERCGPILQKLRYRAARNYFHFFRRHFDLRQTRTKSRNPADNIRSRLAPSGA
jgi:hypothetical protein